LTDVRNIWNGIFEALGIDSFTTKIKMRKTTRIRAVISKSVAFFIGHQYFIEAKVIVLKKLKTEKY
jgi:uncharacterized Zn finger protein